MNDDTFRVGLFFVTVVVLALGIPLVRAWVRRQDRAAGIPQRDPTLDDRLARIELAVEAMALEVERISEGQRFVTKLLSERERTGGALPPAPR